MKNAIKILADGTQLEAGSDRTDHVALLFPDTGLMVHPVSLGDTEGDPVNHDACTKLCADLRVLGHEDWALATREEWERYVLDLTRYDPAVDTNLYPGIKPRWHWTSTPAAWSSASAWVVYAGDGNVYYYLRGSYGFALAVRRAGQ